MLNLYTQCGPGQNHIENMIKPIANLEAIDKIWLSQILSNYFDSKIEVFSYEVEALSGREGFLSEIAFISVTFSIGGDTKEEYLVVKCMPQSEAERCFVINGSLAKREVDFYKFAQSQLFQAVLSKSGLKLVIPDLIFCALENNDMTIVMKNAKRLNYKTIILRDGTSLDQTLKAFSSLAVIHAGGLCYLNKYNNFGVKKFIDFSFYDQFLEPNLEKLKEIFKEDELNNVFKKLIPLSKIIRNFSQLHPLFETVIHGDFWSGQCMYSEDEQQVCVLDWQFCNVGNPIVDLMGMFSMSTDPIVLENHLDQILQHYWGELSMNLERSQVALPCSYEEFEACVQSHWMTGFNFIAVSLHDFLGANNISEKRLKGLISFLHKRNVFSNFLEETNAKS